MLMSAHNWSPMSLGFIVDWLQLKAVIPISLDLCNQCAFDEDIR